MPRLNSTKVNVTLRSQGKYANINKRHTFSNFGSSSIEHQIGSYVQKTLNEYLQKGVIGKLSVEIQGKLSEYFAGMFSLLNEYYAEKIKQHFLPWAFKNAGSGQHYGIYTGSLINSFIADATHDLNDIQFVGSIDGKSSQMRGEMSVNLKPGSRIEHSMMLSGMHGSPAITSGGSTARYAVPYLKAHKIGAMMDNPEIINSLQSWVRKYMVEVSQGLTKGHATESARSVKAQLRNEILKLKEETKRKIEQAAINRIKMRQGSSPVETEHGSVSLDKSKVEIPPKLSYNPSGNGWIKDADAAKKRADDFQKKVSQYGRRDKMPIEVAGIPTPKRNNRSVIDSNGIGTADTTRNRQTASAEKGSYTLTPKELYDKVKKDIQDLTNGRAAETAHPAALLNVAMLVSLAKDSGVPLGDVVSAIGRPRIKDGKEDTSDIDDFLNDLNNDSRTGYNQIVNLSTINNIPDNQDDSQIRDYDPRGLSGQSTVKQAYLERQKDAQDRLLKGEDPRDIWYETGWFYDPINQQWITELPYGKVHSLKYMELRRKAEDPAISDAERKAIEDQIGSKDPYAKDADPKLTLGDILDAPFLYYVLPSYKNIPVFIGYDTANSRTEGYMAMNTPKFRGKPVIMLNAASPDLTDNDPANGFLVPLFDNLKGLVKSLYGSIPGTIDHEVGHAIQQLEGRIPGANPKTYMRLYNTTDEDAQVVPITPHRRLNALRMAQYFYSLLLKSQPDLQEFFTKTKVWESVLGKHWLSPILGELVDKNLLKPHELDWYISWSKYVDQVKNYTAAIDHNQMDYVSPTLAYRLSGGEVTSMELEIRGRLTPGMRMLADPIHTPRRAERIVGAPVFSDIDQMHSEFLTKPDVLQKNIPISDEEYKKAGMSPPTSTGLPTDKDYLDLDHGYGVATVRDPNTGQVIIKDSTEDKTGSIALSGIDRNRLLFWDAPLKQQKNIWNLIIPKLTGLAEKLEDLPLGATGQQFFESLVKYYKGITSDPAEAKLKATNDLVELGIQGAAYLVKGSNDEFPAEARVTLWTLDPNKVGQLSKASTLQSSTRNDTQPSTLDEVIDKYIATLPQLKAHFQKYIQPILAREGGNSLDIEATGRTPIKSRLETDDKVLTPIVEEFFDNDPSKLTGLFNVDVMFDSPNQREVAVSALEQAKHFLRKFGPRWDLPQTDPVHHYEYGVYGIPRLSGVIHMYTKPDLVYEKFKSLLDQWRDSVKDKTEYKPHIRAASKLLRGLSKKLDNLANTQDPKISASLYAKLLGMGEDLIMSSLPKAAGNSLSDLSAFIENTLTPKNQNNSNVSSSASSGMSSSGTSTAIGTPNLDSNANTSNDSTSNSNVAGNIPQQTGNSQAPVAKPSASKTSPKSPQAYQVLYQDSPNEKPIYGYIENSDGTISPVPLNRNSLLNSEPSLVKPDFVRKGSTTFYPRIFDSNGRPTKEAQTLIEVFRTGDRSTIFHELAHTWLETMKEMFKQSLLKGQALKDWSTLSKELGFAGIDFTKPLSDRGQAVWHDSQEKFASLIEQYLWKGKAPSQRLRNIFRKVSQWLRQVYQKLTDIIYIDHNGRPQHFTPSKDLEDIVGRMLDNGLSVIEVENALAYHPELRDQIDAVEDQLKNKHTASSESTQTTQPIQYIRVTMPDGTIQFVREGTHIDGKAIIQDKPTYVRIKQSNGTFVYVRSDQIDQVKQQSTVQ